MNALLCNRRWQLAGIMVLLLTVVGRLGAQEPVDAGDAESDATQPVRHVRVLVIGNSFSWNATAYLPAIAKAAGVELTLGHASIGGCSLERHWRHAAAFEADSTDPEGRPYEITVDGQKRKVSLRERLQSQPWDYVTIQQVSYQSTKAETFSPHAQNLAAYIRRHAPQARLMVHQTWAYAADDPLFRDGKMTQDDMYQALRSAYAAIAEELGAGIIPVADAFQHVRVDPNWQYVYPDPAFDYANPRPPALPNQANSLNIGYHWRQDKDGNDVLKYDGHHANIAGRYLGAAVWFQVLYGTSAVGNDFVPTGLTPEQVAFLQKAAEATVSAAAEAVAR